MNPTKTTSNITSIGGRLLPNQDYSITDLMDMGVRRLSVDIHYFNRALRVCHGQENGFGCGVRSRLWSNWVEEVALWMKNSKNENEIVLINIEDYLKEHNASFLAPLNHHLGDLIYSIPMDQDIITWPSVNQLLKQGKRLVVFLQNGSYGFQMGKEEYTEFVENLPKTFKKENLPRKKFFDLGFVQPGYPSNFAEDFVEENCEVNGHGGFPNLIFQRYNHLWMSLTENLAFPLGENKGLRDFITNAEKDLGVKDSVFGDHEKLTPEIVKKITKCNFTSWEMDFIKPERLVPAIWSWDISEPSLWGKGKNCALMKNSKGRWESQYCHEKKRYSCSHGVNKYNWKITGNSGPWDQGDKICVEEFGDEYYFDVPGNAFQNNLINKLRSNNEEEIWLGFASPGKKMIEVHRKDVERPDPTSGVINLSLQNKASHLFFSDLGNNFPRQFKSLHDNNNNRNRQIWAFEKVSKYDYQIKSVTSSKCLEGEQKGEPPPYPEGSRNYFPSLTGEKSKKEKEKEELLAEYNEKLAQWNSANSGLELTLKKCDSKKSLQIWSIDYQQNGYYTIANDFNYFCIDISADKEDHKKLYTKYMQFECLGDLDSQKFKFEERLIRK